MPPRMAVRSGVRPITAPCSRVTKISPRELINSAPATNLGFETYTTYTNGLPYPVVISLRNGLSLTIPPLNQNWQQSPDFVATVRYRFAKGVKIDTHRLFDAISENDSEETKALKEAISDARVNVSYNGHECTLRYHVDVRTFEEHRGAMYIHELDIALSLDDPESPVYHPESTWGRELQLQHTKDVGLVYQICINDTEQRYGKRWANIGGRVLPVRVVEDHTRKEGVYVTIAGHHHQSKTEEIYYTFESASAELMLFSTESEARTLGNMAEERKREFENLQHDQRMLTLKMEEEHKSKIHELEMRLAQQKQEKADRESKMAKVIAKLKKAEAKFAYKLEKEARRLEKEAKRRDAQLAKEKAERESRMLGVRDHYEHRSYDRKDTSEIVKWLPALAVGAGVLVSKFFF